jgi:TonB family protein
MWRRNSVATGMFASLVLHGAWLAGLSTDHSARRTLPQQRAPRAAYEQPFDALVAPPSTESKNWAAREVALGGPETKSALDLDARPGRGGVDVSEERELLLFSFASPLTLQDTDLNNLRKNQVQRIATSPLRATQEERRATPHPADAVFLASGAVGHAQRREPAPHDAQQGAEMAALKPRVEASAEAEAHRRAGDLPRDDLSVEARGAAREPKQEAQRPRLLTPRGIAHGTSKRAQLAAKVQFARPNVDRGPPATPAEALDARVRDNHDAELLAAAMQRSIVDASSQRAQRRAEGSGGASDGPGLDHEGESRGARAHPYLPGPGRANALDTQDRRYVRWFVEQKERVQSELIFPTPRALAKDQGVSIYRVVVRRDGRLAGAPHLVRSSGFSDFDEAAVIAIRRALPFSPLPDQLLSGAEDLSLLIPVAFSNPMVQ